MPQDLPLQPSSAGSAQAPTSAANPIPNPPLLPHAIQLARNPPTVGTISLQDGPARLFDSRQPLWFRGCKLDREAGLEAVYEISQIKNTNDRKCSTMQPAGATRKIDLIDPRRCHLMASIGIVCKKDGKLQHRTARIGAKVHAVPSPHNPPRYQHTFSLIPNQKPDNTGSADNRWKPADFVSNTCNLQYNGVTSELAHGEAVVISKQIAFPGELYGDADEQVKSSHHSEMLLLKVATSKLYSPQFGGMVRSLAKGSTGVLGFTMTLSGTYSLCADCGQHSTRLIQVLRRTLTDALGDKYQGRTMLPMKLILFVERPYTGSQFFCTLMETSDMQEVKIVIGPATEEWPDWPIQVVSMANPCQVVTDKQLREGVLRQGDGESINLDVCPQPVLCCVMKFVGRMYRVRVTPLNEYGVSLYLSGAPSWLAAWSAQRAVIHHQYHALQHAVAESLDYSRGGVVEQQAVRRFNKYADFLGAALEDVDAVLDRFRLAMHAYDKERPDWIKMGRVEQELQKAAKELNRAMQQWFVWQGCEAVQDAVDALIKAVPHLRSAFSELPRLVRLPTALRLQKKWQISSCLGWAT